MSVRQVAATNVVGTTLVATFGASTLAGSVISVFVCGAFGSSPPPVSDNQSTSYGSPKASAQHLANSERAWCWCGVPPSAGVTAVTLSPGSAPGDVTLAVVELTGRNTTSPVTTALGRDAFTPPTTTDGTTVGPITAASGDDLVLFLADTAAVHTSNYNAGTGWTEWAQTGSATGSGLVGFTGALESVSAGSITATATADTTDSTIGLLMAIAQGGGGGGTVGRLVGGTLCGGVLVGGLLTGF